MTLDLTSFDALLKELYKPEMVQDLTYKDNPLLALIPKDENFVGDKLVVPAIYSNPQGRSATFARAQQRGIDTNTASVKFEITHVRDYSIATIDNLTLETSKSNEGAFVSALQTEMDGALNSLTRSIATALYRTGYGEIGSVGSFSTTTITLGTADDVTNFEVGMELSVVSGSTPGNSVRANGSSGNGLIVTGIDRSAGTLSFAYNVNDATNGVPTIANGDLLGVRGDVSTSRVKCAGLGAWVPTSAPSSTSFFGVNRTIDSTRLGGLRVTATSLPIEEALIEAQYRLGREGGKPTHVFMSFAKFGDLVKALGSKVQYVDIKATASVGFSGIQLIGPRGTITVVPDMNCPTSVAYMLQLDTWKLASLGKLVRFFETDGNKVLRQSTADGVEIRSVAYYNLACKAPGWNAVISF